MYNSNWYDSLNKPFLTPPEYLFAPVWIFLYISMLFAFIIFIQSSKFQFKLHGIYFFCSQLALNLLWSPVFFSMKNIKLAFSILCFMWIFLLGTTIMFYKTEKISAYLMLPYLLWTTFALYLNFGFVFLNSEI